MGRVEAGSLAVTTFRPLEARCRYSLDRLSRAIASLTLIPLGYCNNEKNVPF